MKNTISSLSMYHCAKSVRIRSYSGPHFPAFGLNTERYSVSLRIQSECGKMQTRITPNTDTFHTVYFNTKNYKLHNIKIKITFIFTFLFSCKGSECTIFKLRPEIPYQATRIFWFAIFGKTD